MSQAKLLQSAISNTKIVSIDNRNILIFKFLADNNYYAKLVLSEGDKFRIEVGKDPIIVNYQPEYSLDIVTFSTAIVLLPPEQQLFDEISIHAPDQLVPLHHRLEHEHFAIRSGKLIHFDRPELGIRIELERLIPQEIPSLYLKQVMFDTLYYIKQLKGKLYLLLSRFAESYHKTIP